jgi:hypothetical protein
MRYILIALLLLSITCTKIFADNNILLSWAPPEDKESLNHGADSLLEGMDGDINNFEVGDEVYVLVETKILKQWVRGYIEDVKKNKVKLRIRAMCWYTIWGDFQCNYKDNSKYEMGSYEWVNIEYLERTPSR